MMDRNGTGFLADLLQYLFAHLAAVPMHLDLDKFMRIETGFDFAHNIIGKAVIADHDDRIEAMAKGAQMTDLFGAELAGLHFICPWMEKGWQFSR